MIAAITAWDGRIAPVFDVTRQATVLTLADGRETAARRELTLAADPVAKVVQLAEAGIETLLCGAISQPIADLLAARNIKVIPFLAGNDDDVLAAFLKGKLPTAAFAMPGCCGRRRQCGCGQGGQRGRGRNRKCGPTR
jgi:predicted Fe-Mo cluster-binding NifX family protein